jgi:hypothetical protein
MPSYESAGARTLSLLKLCMARGPERQVYKMKQWRDRYRKSQLLSERIHSEKEGQRFVVLQVCKFEFPVKMP